MPADVSARRTPLRRSARWPSGVALGLALGGLLIAARPGRPPDLLQAALREAERNCARAPALPRRGDRPWFRTRAIRRALDEDPRLLARDHGELDALYDEAAWLATVRDAGDLGGRSRGDLAFLTGLLHWYLRRAEGRPSGGCSSLPPAAARVVFRDLDYLEVLSAWD